MVAVTARATYVESFEFKIDADADVDIASLFNFSYWGKKSRNSQEEIDFSGESSFEPLDNNWYKATCRFSVPDEVAMMRTFELANVTGEWNTLEIRKHRVQLVSDCITKVNYTDSVSLETLAEQNAELPALLKTLEQKEREEASLLLKRWELEDLIALTAGKNEEDVQKLITDKNKKKENLEQKINYLKSNANKLKAAYDKEKANPLNYWCKIKTDRNKYFHFNTDKFLTEWYNNHARFKFIAKGNDWYEIITDTNIGHLRGYGSDKKYLHVNQEKVLCAWSNVPARLKFEEKGNWYIAKLNTDIGNLIGTDYKYLHFDRFNNLVAWKDSPLQGLSLSRIQDNLVITTSGMLNQNGKPRKRNLIESRKS